MGQQQIILFVLGIVIVGLAVAVGITTFDVNRRQSDVDRVVVDNAKIAAQAQAWKLSPGVLGGGREVDGFTGFRMATLGLETTDMGKYEVYQPAGLVAFLAWIENGVLNLRSVVWTQGPLTLAIAENDAHIVVVTTVDGTNADDIQTTVLK